MFLSFFETLKFFVCQINMPFIEVKGKLVEVGQIFFVLFLHLPGPTPPGCVDQLLVVLLEPPQLP